MPVWSRIAAGLVLAGALIGLAGFKAYSEKLGPLVQAHGTTYYNGDGPASAPVACKPESEIVAAIGQVHAKYDYLAGADLKAFEQRAAVLKGCRRSTSRSSMSSPRTTSSATGRWFCSSGSGSIA